MNLDEEQKTVLDKPSPSSPAPAATGVLAPSVRSRGEALVEAGGWSKTLPAHGKKRR